MCDTIWKLELDARHRCHLVWRVLHESWTCMTCMFCMQSGAMVCQQTVLPLQDPQVGNWLASIGHCPVVSFSSQRPFCFWPPLDWKQRLRVDRTDVQSFAPTPSAGERHVDRVSAFRLRNDQAWARDQLRSNHSQPFGLKPWVIMPGPVWSGSCFRA